jgi:probable rRNA maturation factor
VSGTIDPKGKAGAWAERSPMPENALVHIGNHQRTRFIDRKLLCRITRTLLWDILGREKFELAVHVVGKAEIRRLNEKFVCHAGATDVISFDYTEPAEPEVLRGEVFVCLPIALSQAAKYRTTWQEEVVRYVVHGVLHLRGFDDRTANQRRRMRRKEGAVLRRLAAEYHFARLGTRTSL